ncbi:MAG: 16S rRNA (cytosine(967)-C(5))-methyltransferase RsmB [Clostridiales bacterium]|nr:16S rRNA (cytosine(967)-C(5))-methyltransferase RsmB [Clostridiales bacterium]
MSYSGFKSVNKPTPGDKSQRVVKKDPAAAPSQSRLLALRALYDVFFNNAYSNLALDKELRQARLSEEDRRLATNIFYQAIEHRKKTDYLLGAFIDTPPEDLIKCILHIAVAQLLYLDRIPDHAAVNEAVNQTKLYKKQEASGFVNGVLRQLLRDKEAGKLREVDKTDFVSWLEIEYSASRDIVQLLIEAYGEEETEAILAYKPEKRFETIRTNTLRSSDEETEAFLTSQGYDWEKSVIPHCYRVYKSGNLSKTRQYSEGLYSIQGESAVLAAMAVKAKRGMNVLDTCAAPGGKAFMLAEQMQGTGRVYAWDLHEHRVELIKSGAKRLRLDNIRCSVKDATVPRSEMLQSADAVIIDAPCSGLGVMADKPDIRYSLTRARLLEIIHTQEKLLDVCSEYVRIGGTLVYSTCTVLPQENEEQIMHFLNSHPNYKLDDDCSYLPAPLNSRSENGMVQLLQNRDAVEGFFIARLKRIA